MKSHKQFIIEVNDNMHQGKHIIFEATHKDALNQYLMQKARRYHTEVGFLARVRTKTEKPKEARHYRCLFNPAGEGRWYILNVLHCNAFTL